MAALFDTIHDDALSKRAEPATLEEFVEFGLQPRDYTHYVGLQMRVQGELMALWMHLRGYSASNY